MIFYFGLAETQSLNIKLSNTLLLLSFQTTLAAFARPNLCCGSHFFTASRNTTFKLLVQLNHTRPHFLHSLLFAFQPLRAYLFNLFQTL